MIWAQGLALLLSPAKLFGFFKSPVGVLLLAVGLYGVGYWRGSSAKEAEWKAKAAASIEAARQIDTKAATEALAAKDRQLKDAEAREAARKKELDLYVEALSRAGANGRCSIDDLFPANPPGSNPSGLRGNVVPGRPTNLAPNR